MFWYLLTYYERQKILTKGNNQIQLYISSCGSLCNRSYCIVQATPMGGTITALWLSVCLAWGLSVCEYSLCTGRRSLCVSHQEHNSTWCPKWSNSGELPAMATFQVALPENFDFSSPEQWPGCSPDLRDSEPLQASRRTKTQCRSVHSCTPWALKQKMF